MEDLLPVLLSFPPHPPPANQLSDIQYDNGIRSQIESLKKLTFKQLTRPTSSGENLLDVINPALNSVPYVHALLANFQALRTNISASISSEDLWQKMVMFLISFDPRQIRYVGPELSQVMVAVATFARQSNQLGLAVAPIANAILRLDPAGSTLTSNHLLLAQVTLESQAYADAVSVLDRHVVHFSSASQPSQKFLCSLNLAGHQYLTQSNGLTQKLTYQNVLEYFIYTGTIYIGLRQWERALESLEVVVTYPVKDGAISFIMVEAYKKWTLVNLLLNGKAASLPSTTYTNASKLYRNLCKPYEVVASLFATGTASRLHAEVTAGQTIWANDGNTGLMLILLSTYQEFRIRNLAKIYRSISISDITQMTFSAETGKKLPNDQATENLIKDMISRRVLHANITHPAHSSTMLTFSATGPVLSETDVQQELANSLRDIKAMAEDVKVTDRRLTQDKEYLKWAHKQKSGGNAAEEPGVGGSDEDLMAF